MCPLPQTSLLTITPPERIAGVDGSTCLKGLAWPWGGGLDFLALTLVNNQQPFLPLQLLVVLTSQRQG